MVFFMTAAAGRALTVMVTEFVLVQLLVFTHERIYVVVTLGVTVGLELLEVNPDGELVHE